MSELLEWQLDDWIAEKFMGWNPIDSGDLQIICWEMKDGKMMTWEPTSFGSFKPSTDPAAFALVKREIERRGWDWEADSMRGREDGFGFGFSIYEGLPRLVRLALVLADSEELAGCLAVKAAIERMAHE